MRKIVPLDLRHRFGLMLSRRIEKLEQPENRLRQLFWECTLRCNLNCRHCGSDCHREAQMKDMPVADFLAVVDNIAAAPENDPNKIMVIFTGGEALMRKDIEDCGRELIKRGFPWSLVTNGFALTEKRLDSLMAAGLHSITVSLDGFQEQHDWMRCVDGSFKRAANAIEMLAKRDVVYDVVTCVNKRNISQLHDLKEYLVSIGLKRWRLFTVFPAGRAANDEDMKLSTEEFRSLMEFIVETRKEGKIHANYGCEGFLGNYEGDVRDNFYKCHAGVSIASVLADGSISACPSIRANYHQGNIYRDDFMDVWRNKFVQYRDREWMKVDECADCKYFKYCKGNGMHLRDDNGKLMHCHLKKLGVEI